MQHHARCVEHSRHGFQRTFRPGLGPGGLDKVSEDDEREVTADIFFFHIYNATQRTQNTIYDLYW